MFFWFICFASVDFLLDSSTFYLLLLKRLCSVVSPVELKLNLKYSLAPTSCHTWLLWTLTHRPASQTIKGFVTVVIFLYFSESLGLHGSAELWLVNFTVLLLLHIIPSFFKKTLMHQISLFITNIIFMSLKILIVHLTRFYCKVVPVAVLTVVPPQIASE